MSRPEVHPEPLFFWRIQPRIATRMSHTVIGRAFCEAGTGKLTISITGTMFPSHRLWVNGQLVHTAPQGRWLTSAPGGGVTARAARMETARVHGTAREPSRLVVARLSREVACPGSR